MNSENLKKIFSGKNTMRIIFIAGMCGILLIFVSGYFTPKSTTKEDSSAKTSDTAIDEYISSVTEQLKSIVMSITGEAEPQIMITAETSIKKIYAREEKQSTTGDQSDSENTFVVVKDSSGNQQGVIITEEQPVIKGVVVVSISASDPVTKEKILNAVMTAFNLPSNKVCVVSKYK